MTIITVPQQIKYLVATHGGIRPAARAVGIDQAYLKRLMDGDKTNPSDDTLAKLGLVKCEFHRLLTP